MSPDALFMQERTDAAGNTNGLWELREGWAWTFLSEVTEPSVKVDPRKLGRLFTYIDLAAVEAGKIGRAQEIQADKAPSRARQLVKAGDTLFSGVRVYLKNIALAGEIHNGAIASTAFCVLRPTAAIDPRYLYFFVNWQRFISSLLPLQRGNSPPAVLDSDVRAQPIPIAPIPEQRRIVAQIDELFAEIAEGEAALERARQGFDAWRRALLKAAVTGELTRDWREANRRSDTGADLLARIRAERETVASRSGKGRRVTTSNSAKTSPLPALPEGWAWTRLGDLSSLITSGSRGWKRYYAGNGTVFIRAQNLRTDRLELEDVAYVELPSATEGIRTRVSQDDILVTITGANVTRSARVDVDLAEAYVNQHVGLVRLADPRLSDFVFLVLVTPSHGRKQLKAAAYGAGKPGLNLNDLASVLVPLPPPARNSD
jgi:type I restriction enzyme S subunit